MKKKQSIASWAILTLLVLVSSGCALVNTAISAGIAYGIYQASK